MTEQYVAEIDDDIALSPHEIIEGLNADLLNKAVVDKLEVVEDEQAWERPIVNDQKMCQILMEPPSVNSHP
jgi:hypothetical protein